MLGVGGAMFPEEGQVGGRWCHLVVARSAAPWGPKDLGSPFCLGPPSWGPSCAFGAALARTHIPTPAFSLSPATTHLPRERQLLPRLQCSRLSLQHRGEYLLATSTLRPGGGQGWATLHAGWLHSVSLSEVLPGLMGR